ncbi:MAG TPA: hypothetical protein VHJ79_14475, partial [Mycobacterium sp.]|nr:hypothetical protein [Mycobacterium sp.]
TISARHALEGRIRPPRQGKIPDLLACPLKLPGIQGIDHDNVGVPRPEQLQFDTGAVASSTERILGKQNNSQGQLGISGEKIAGLTHRRGRLNLSRD